MNSTARFDRALREVKALARLDHRHVIRYFNAWLEIDEVLVSDEQVDSTREHQQADLGQFDALRKNSKKKRPKIKEVKEGESGGSKLYL
jgi:hypothetical protein